MAYVVIDNNKGANDPDKKSFQIGNISDLSTLPTSTTSPRCSIGSTCLLESTTEFKVYILCTDNTWKEFK